MFEGDYEYNPATGKIEETYAAYLRRRSPTRSFKIAYAPEREERKSGNTS